MQAALEESRAQAEELSEAKREIESMQTMLSDARAEAVELTEANVWLKAEVSNHEQTRAEKEATICGVEKEVASLRASLQENVQQLLHKEASLARALDEIAELSKTKEALHETQSSVEALKSEIIMCKEEHAKQLRLVKEEMEGAHKSKIHLIKGELDMLRSSLSEKNSMLAMQKSELEKSQRQLEDAERRLTVAEDKVATFRELRKAQAKASQRNGASVNSYL